MKLSPAILAQFKVMWCLIIIMNCCSLPAQVTSPAWGFFPHKMINRLAVFTLPPSMGIFYKYHIHTLTQWAVKPDQRRYTLAQEAPRHFLDLDYYGEEVPRDWEQAVLTYPQDSLQQHGILPWHMRLVKYRLTQAFINADASAILSISADAGHYLADAHVPLHTTSNYNGQQTAQHGIHGFWETRVPELLWDEFDLWVGKVTYQENFYQDLWQVLWDSHKGVDSVLQLESVLTAQLPIDKKFGIETRGQRTIKVYSEYFSHLYHQHLDRQVERRLREAIKFIGNFWYTCWVDAGQPDLHHLIGNFQDSVVWEMDSKWQNSHILRDSFP